MGQGIFTGRHGYEEFKDDSRKPFGMAGISDIVQTNQVYLAVFIWLQLVMVWVAGYVASLITGMALGGTPVTFSSLPHVIWQAVNAVALVYSLQAIYYGVYMNEKTIKTNLIMAIVFMFIAMAVNIVHEVGAALEWINGVSDLFLTQFGFLVALIAVLGVMMLLQAWTIWRLFVHMQDSADAMANGWKPGMRMSDIEAPDAPASAPEMSDLGDPLRVALLEKQQRAMNYSSTVAPGIGERIIIGGAKSSEVIWGNAKDD